MFSSWKPEKCETQSRLCLGRFKLLRNKRTLQVKAMRKDIAELLRNGKQEYARIRVEGVIRENLLMQAYEILELYLELLAVRSQLIAKTKEIPRDMVEAISSIIYAAQRISDVPELGQLRNLFAAKYGKEYAQEASADTTCTKWQVNTNLIRCLLVEPPQPEEKLAMLSEIAQEHGVEWDLGAAARDLLPPGALPPGAAIPAMPPMPTGSAAPAPMPAPLSGMPGQPQMTFMDAQQAAAAAAAAAAHAKAMAEYAAQMAIQHHVNTGAMPQLQPALSQGWLAQQTMASPSSLAAAGPGPSTSAAPQAPAGFKSMEEVQRAYDSALGPPTKGSVGQSSPASAPPPPPPNVPMQGLQSLPQPPLPLPSPPQELPSAPARVVPGTSVVHTLPHPPTAKVGAEPEDEYEELTRRLEALKRS